MFLLPPVIRIDVPVLDRLVDWLLAKDQARIDATVATVRSLTERLKQSSTALEAVSKKEN